VSLQSLQPASGNWSFNPDGLNLLGVPIQLLSLCVAQGRVLLIVLVFIVVLLLLLLLIGCALGCWALRYL
jgi:hypothetical protein